jgi:hypothetical protein
MRNARRAIKIPVIRPGLNQLISSRDKRANYSLPVTSLWEGRAMGRFGGDFGVGAARRTPRRGQPAAENGSGGAGGAGEPN